MAAAKKICIIGSGNWGSVIAKIVGNNVRNNPKFNSQVPMYVYEEMIDGQKLTEIINTKHENVKYLPGHTLPDNVIAVADAAEAAKDADYLVFVIPHQFIKNICKAMHGKIKSSAIGVSLIKGLDINENGLQLISNVISKSLSIPCGVLMGANIAHEVAQEDFCEATIGCHDADQGQMLKEMMQTPYFRIVVVDDVETVELCGALKNIIATGAGFIDGLGMGNNTKAAVIRLGLMEMIKFCQMRDNRAVPFFYINENIVAVGAGVVGGLGFGDNTKAAVIRLGLMEMVKFVGFYTGKSSIETFLESCGIADVVTTCYTGRNKRVAEAFVKTGKSIEQLEQEMLNGQKLQGPPTAAEVNVMLKQKGLEDAYPLFTAIHKICIGELPPSAFIDCLRNHPEHIKDTIGRK